MRIFQVKAAAVLVIVFLAGFPVSRADAVEEESSSALTLPALIEEVLRNSPHLSAAKARWEAAREEIPQARSLEDPQLSIARMETPSGFFVGDASETRYGIEQSFPFPGKRSLREQVSVKSAEAVEREYRAKIREVVADLKTAYYQLFLVHKTIDLHRVHQGLLEEIIRSASEKYAVGQVSQQDVLKAQVELSALHNSLLTVEQEQVSVEARINALRNRPPGTAVGIPVEPEYRPFPSTLEELRQQAIGQGPELQSASLRIDRSGLNRTLAGKNTLPDFMVGLEYRNVQEGPDPWMMTGRINLPWFFRLKYDARLRQAAAEEREARAGYADLQNRTLARIQDLFERIKTAEALIQTYRAGVLPQAEQSLEAARIGYASGKVDFLNLIDSERTLLDFQLDDYAALARFWQSVAELERIVGSDIEW